MITIQLLLFNYIEIVELLGEWFKSDWMIMKFNLNYENDYLIKSEWSNYN